MTERLVLSVALLAIVLLPPVRAPSQEKSPGKGAAEERKPPTIELVESGEGRKRSLRYHPKKGARETLVLTLGMEVSQDVGGAKTPAPKLPDQRMTMGMEVTDVAANGDISYDFELKKAEVVGKAGVPPFIAGQIGQFLSQLEGLSGNAVVSSRGFTKKAHVDIPDGLPPFVRQLLEGFTQSVEQLSNPLPDEPIAPGAKWVVTWNMNQNGIEILQKASYELVSLDGDNAEIHVRIEQKADPQEFRPPGTPPGTTAQLESFDSSGKGTIKIDLEKLVPEKSRVEMQNNAAVEIESFGETRKIESATKMSIDMESRPTEK